MLKTLTLIMLVYGSLAAQQRIPGRTGGSINNPFASINPSPPGAPRCPLASQAAEQQDFRWHVAKRFQGLPKE